MDLIIEVPDKIKNNLGITVKETLINYLCGMKRKAHGAQKPRHIPKLILGAPGTRINFGIRGYLKLR